MLHLSRSKQNILAKPDIITCNSLLNACAYDDRAHSATEKAAIVDIYVKTLEKFQSRVSLYGWPNHVTYVNTLQAMQKHVSDCEKCTELAEATFWQCCEKGIVSFPVVTSLHCVLPWKRFSYVMSDVLLSKEDEALHFNWKLLPREWKRYAPAPHERLDRPPKRATS